MDLFLHGPFESRCVASALDASRQRLFCHGLGLISQRHIPSAHGCNNEDRCLDEGEMDIMEMVSGDGKVLEQQGNASLTSLSRTCYARKSA